nr:MAG TPA: hypothetical protein [Caudoviricetes sp.]
MPEKSADLFHEGSPEKNKPPLRTKGGRRVQNLTM